MSEINDFLVIFAQSMITRHNSLQSEIQLIYLQFRVIVLKKQKKWRSKWLQVCALELKKIEHARDKLYFKTDHIISIVQYIKWIHIPYPWSARGNLLYQERQLPKSLQLILNSGYLAGGKTRKKTFLLFSVNFTTIISTKNDHLSIGKWPLKESLQLNQWSPWGAPISGGATEGGLCQGMILWVEKSVLCSRLDQQTPLQPCWTNFQSGWYLHWSLKIVIPRYCQSKYMYK